METYDAVLINFEEFARKQDPKKYGNRDDLYSYGVSLFQEQLTRKKLNKRGFLSRRPELTVEQASTRLVEMGLARDVEEGEKIMDSMAGKEITQRGNPLRNLAGFKIIEIKDGKGDKGYKVSRFIPD